MADERPLTRQHSWVSVHEIGEVGQLLPQAGIGKQGSDAALDVNPGVRAGRPGPGTPTIELLLVLHQVERQGLQHAPSLLEGHPPQVVASHRPSIGIR